jgi:hypothetical protein
MKIDHVKPLTVEMVDEAGDLAAKAGKLEEKIVDRIHYIMLNIFKLFSKKSAYWYFYGASEGEVGDLWKHFHQDSISVIIDNCPGESMEILLKDGSEWGFEDSIPTRWLYEDFECELIEGKKKYEEKEIARQLEEKNKRFQKKGEDQRLASAAKKKLTKEELRALKKVL